MIKKRRRYYYPSPLAIDKFNTQVFKALNVKLNRDYLEFFGRLSKLYQRGELKKRLMATTNTVHKSISILDSMISTTKVSKEQVEALVQNIEVINADRDYYVDLSEQNKSLQDKMYKVEEATGVSPKDINITKEIIVKGAAQTKRRTKEGTIPFLQRTMPGTMQLGAELGKGVLGAVLGPFAPIAGMAGEVARGVVGAGLGIKEKIASQREARLGGRLAPMAQGLDPSVFQKIAGARERGPAISGFRGVSRRAPARRRTKEELVMPLQYFFDKKAHKAKWTKDMSDRFKSIEKAMNKWSGKGIGGMFGDLTSGITPLIAKIGLLTAGITGAILSFSKIAKAWDAFSELRGAKKGLAESKAAMKEAAGPGSAWEKHILSQEDPLAALKEYKMKGKLAPQMAAQLEKRITPEYVKAHKQAAKWTGQTEEARALTERLSGRENLLAEMPQRMRDPFARSNEDMKKGLMGVQKAVEKVSETLARQQGSAVKGINVGDPFGEGSPFTMGLSKGSLSMEED